MDEEEEQRRSVRDFISSLPIYIYNIYIYIALPSRRVQKKREESSSKEKGGGPVPPPPFFVLCVPKKRRAL